MTTMTIKKTYSKASNARRAAKAAGLSEFDVYKVADGTYKIRSAPIRAAMAAKAAKAPKASAAKEPKEPRETKITQLVDLITTGATITKLTEPLGWQEDPVAA